MQIHKIIIFILLLPLGVQCQNTIGLPEILNYNKNIYKAGLQNWDIKQSQNGIIYFANNEGLLSFDGSFWNLYASPNKTVTRSVYISKNNLIYVGGQDEIGYFKPDANGVLYYTSIISLIPVNDRSFGDVWDIEYYNDALFFRSSYKIFKLANNVITTYTATKEWLYMGLANNTLYAQDAQNGLLNYTTDSFMLQNITNSILKGSIVTSIIPTINNTFIITTLKNGLFFLNNNSIIALQNNTNQIFKTNRIYNATIINNTNIALATNNNGIYIINFQGDIIQNISKPEGIQNKNVLSIFVDVQGNIWLGLDNGIDFIAYNSSIKHINPFLQDASSYAAIIFKNSLYIGSSNGVSSVPLQDISDYSNTRGQFKPVGNTKGQVWSLTEINNQLLLGHHEGAFIINNNTATPFASNTGYWNFFSIASNTQNPLMVAGNYNGLAFFNGINNIWQLQNSVANFNESSRYVATSDGAVIWVSHPYHGVFCIKKTNNNNYISLNYTLNKGLPIALNNHIFKVGSTILVTNNKGVYIYNSKQDIFEVFNEYQKIFGNKNIRYLKEDASGNIWFIENKSIGVVYFKNKQASLIYIPELHNKLLSGFEFIYPVNNTNIFIGGATGLYHINLEKYKTNNILLPILIRSVRIGNTSDSVLYGGNIADTLNTNTQIKSIKSNFNIIRFEFASPIYGYQNNLEYSYRLKGLDNNWAEFTKRTEKEYTYLPAGSYTFEVKVRNNLGVESNIVSYKFIMLPKWYVSNLAKIIYFLLVALLLYFIYKWQKKKFKLQKINYQLEQKKLLYVLELEGNKKESEIINLQNEKLEADINFQNAELATSAMHLVKKGELLTKIKAELAHIIKEIDNPKAQQELKKLNRALNDDDKLGNEWEQFAKHFDKVHSNFLVLLKAKHPAITPNELKLSAYLRMNLSTKEIAQLMNITLRGVEISRYRLRKKLALETETSLFDYLIKI